MRQLTFCVGTKNLISSADTPAILRTRPNIGFHPDAADVEGAFETN